MRLFHSRLLWKYFASYFCFLMLPLCGLGIFVFNYFSSYLQQDVIANNRDMVKQIQNITDSQYQSIKDIAFQISADPDLTPYRIRNNANHAKAIVESLKTYKSTNGFIHEFFLYMRGDTFIYSPYSSYTPERLLQNAYTYENWSLPAFKRAIEEADSPSIRPAEPVVLHDNKDVIDRFITFIVPIPVYEPFPYGTLVFQVREQKLNEQIQGLLENYGGNSIILDGSGQIVSSLQDEEYLRSPAFADLSKNVNGSVSERVGLGKRAYLMSAVKSAQSGWTYMTLIPEKEIMANVSAMKWRVLLGLIIMLLTGSAIIYYLSFRHYFPIRRLKEFAEEKWGAKLGAANEIDAVRLVVDYLSDNNQSLISQVQSSVSALRDQYLFKLLKGQIYSIQELNDQGREVRLTFAYPRLFVVVIGIHASVIGKDAFIAYLENHLPAGTDGYVKDSMDDKSIVLLLSSEAAGGPRLKLQMEALKQSIHQDLDMQATIGVGSAYEEPHLMGKSYLEALTAYNYRMILGNNKVISFHDISGKVNELEKYPKKDIERLELALKREDADTVGDLIGNIMQYIKGGNASIFFARCLCYDVINTILKALFDMNADQAKHGSDYPDVIALLKFETVEELELEVRRVCQSLLQTIKESGQASDLKRRALAYVQEHYCDPGFSVQQAAEHCQVSASYLSRIFKELTGQSVTDYLNRMRIRQAEELLQSSDESLQSIVHQVGYYDVSSFIRKFKNQTGVTPGEFRKTRMGR